MRYNELIIPLVRVTLMLNADFLENLPVQILRVLQGPVQDQALLPDPSPMTLILTCSRVGITFCRVFK